MNGERYTNANSNQRKLEVTINFMQSRLQSKVNYHGKEGLNYKEFSSLRKYSNPQCVCA